MSGPLSRFDSSGPWTRIQLAGQSVEWQATSRAGGDLLGVRIPETLDNFAVRFPNGQIAAVGIPGLVRCPSRYEVTLEVSAPRAGTRAVASETVQAVLQAATKNQSILSMARGAGIEVAAFDRMNILQPGQTAGPSCGLRAPSPG